MPLPNITNGFAYQCTATAKHTGKRCLNLCAYQMKVCKVHGARKKETILKGTKHPNYKHGRETLEAKARRSAGLARLRALEELLASAPMLNYRRSRGRKPKSS